MPYRIDQKQLLENWKEDVVAYDEFADALIGIAHQFSETFAVYDASKAIELLMKHHGFDEEEAHEWFQYNVLGQYHGPNTPAFLIARPGLTDEVGSDTMSTAGD